jgi:hypothetical protein
MAGWLKGGWVRRDPSFGKKSHAVSFRALSPNLGKPFNRRVFDPCFLIDEISLSNTSIDGFYRSNSICICICICIGTDRSMTDRPPLLSPRMKNTHRGARPINARFNLIGKIHRSSTIHRLNLPTPPFSSVFVSFLGSSRDEAPQEDDPHRLCVTRDATSTRVSSPPCRDTWGTLQSLRTRSSERYV